MLYKLELDEKSDTHYILPRREISELYNQISSSMPDLIKNGGHTRIQRKESHRLMSTAFLHKYIDIDTFDNLRSESPDYSDLSPKHISFTYERIIANTDTSTDTQPPETAKIAMKALGTSLTDTETSSINRIEETLLNNRTMSQSDRVNEQVSESKQEKTLENSLRRIIRCASDDNIVYTCNMDVNEYSARSKFYKRLKSTGNNVLWYIV